MIVISKNCVNLMVTKDYKQNFDERYLDQIKNVTFQPIFILGFPRSGTSILYKLLNLTNCFNSVTSYHVIKYDQLLFNYLNGKEKQVKKELNQYLLNSGQTDRGIDRLKISADFYEEYGFILKKKSHVLVIKPKNNSLFVEICKKIQFISDNKKPLLLKNPYDFSNFLYIKKFFPQSKFIFIHRNPLKVINSSIKTFKHIFTKKNQYTALLSKDYKNASNNFLLFKLTRQYLSLTIFNELIKHIKYMAKTSKYYLENIDKLDQIDYISIRYEDLCQKPNEIISDIMQFLNLMPTTNNDFSKFINPRKTILLKEVKFLRKYLFKKMRDYFSKFGYRN